MPATLASQTPVRFQTDLWNLLWHPRFWQGRDRFKMADRRVLVRFKPPEISAKPVIAERAEVAGNHLLLWNSKGNLAALFPMEVIESWSEFDI
jgi:hypothetical protein